MVSNTIWVSIDKFSYMAIQLIGTFVLGRFLLPEDFGVLGMLTVFTAVSLTLVESGFPSALVREKNVTNLDYSSVFWFNFIFALVLYAILFFSASLIASFFRLPILKDVSRAAFLVIPLTALSLVQTAICTRNLQFKKLCIISVSSSLLSSIIAIFFAYYYRNVWALVLQNVLTFFFKTMLLWFFSSWHPSIRFSLNSLKKFYLFSKNLLFSGLISNIFNNIYSVFIGRFYTPTDLGYYSQASRLNSSISLNLTSVIQGVSYPILVSVENDGNNIKEAYKKIICVTVLFVGFVMALIMGVSFDLFELLMGSHVWRVAGSYLFIMCINGILFPLHSINQNILLVKGDSKTVLKLELLRRSIMICIIIVTLNFNILVFVCGNAVYSILLLFINLYYCGRPIQYTVTQQLKDVSPILFRLAIMVVISLVVSWFLSQSSIFLRVSVSFFSSLMVGVFLFWKNSYVKETFTILKRIAIKR